MTFVFVHIGPQVYPYIYVALEQVRLFNPENDIFLIANQEALDKTDYDFSRKAIQTVSCESLHPSIYHARAKGNRVLGFAIDAPVWRRAIERFFYIHDFMISKKIQQVIHIESDNMLYVDIATIEHALSRYKGIAAVFDCDTRCIPSFMYIANEQAIEDLVIFFLKNIYCNYTDMSILSLYKSTEAIDKIDSLPLIMPEYCKCQKLVNILGQCTLNSELYYNNSNHFDSIFDGAALGQYLGGIDPKNGLSVPGFINEMCLFDPSVLTFKWCKDSQGRNVPFALFENKAYRINNLHIHSKNLWKFRS